MIDGEFVVLWRLLAYCTDSALVVQNSIVLDDSDAVKRPEPSSSFPFGMTIFAVCILVSLSRFPPPFITRGELPHWFKLKTLGTFSKVTKVDPNRRLCMSTFPTTEPLTIPRLQFSNYWILGIRNLLVAMLAILLDVSSHCFQTNVLDFLGSHRAPLVLR
jgi:hypothetical protein